MTASILPNAKSQFWDSNGRPLAAGQVFFYIPNTSAPKNTWQDAGQTILNTNPIVLDANGQALIYGNGAYRQVVYDVHGNLIWDKITSSPVTGADLSSTTDATNGAGLVGFNYSLSYAAGTIGKWLKDLATSTGAGFIGFIQAGANAIKRTLEDKAREHVSATDYMSDAQKANVRAGLGTIDVTASIIAGMTYLYGRGGGTLELPAGVYGVTSLSFDFPSGITVNLVGEGRKATFLKKLAGTTTPVIDFTAPAGTLEIYSSIRGIGIIGNAKTHDGIKMTNCARFDVRDLDIRACAVAFYSNGSLVFGFYDSLIQNCVTGFLATRANSVYSNDILIQKVTIVGCSTFGADLVYGNGITMNRCDLEQNGTVGDLTTGGIMIRSTFPAESGYAMFSYTDSWLEGNFGYAIQSQAAGITWVKLSNVNMADNEHAGNLRGYATVELTNVICGAPADVFTLGDAGGSSLVTNSIISTLTDSSANRSYTNFLSLAAAVPFKVTAGSYDMFMDGSGNGYAPISWLFPVNGWIGSRAFYVDGALTLKVNDGSNAGTPAKFYCVNSNFANAANTALSLGQNATTSRSINCGGTINASGADYAEYERNNGLVIPKGAIVGFKADGTLTLTFSEAIRPGIKSTNPGCVGGDTWGTEEALGARPIEPADDADESEVAAYLAARDLWNAKLEAARLLVDRIAYAGKVPVNVLGATPGHYIIAVDDGSGGITGISVAAPTDDQKRNAVGRVNRVLPDGRAEVAVIVH